MSLTKDGFFKQLGSTIGSNNYLLQAAGGHIAWGNAASQIPYSNGTVNTNLNADMVDGLHVHTSRNNEANKIVRTDGNGYIQAGWINTSSGNMGTSAINKIYVSNDGFIRYKTVANFKTDLFGSSAIGSSTKPIYWSGSALVACDYSLSSNVNSGTANRLAYYNGANTISATSSIESNGDYLYLNTSRTRFVNLYSTLNHIPPYSITGLKSFGYPVYTDPEFVSGYNSVSTYNNSGGGTVTITREASTESANSSGYRLKIVTNGTASPGAGGFYQTISSRANAIFVQIFRAKIPTGYNVTTASNSMGTNYSDSWLTSQEGTGKWEWYARIVHCGADGTFSSGGHVYLNGTNNTSVTWYLSYCNVIDITKGNYDGLKTRYSDNSDNATYIPFITSSTAHYVDSAKAVKNKFAIYALTGSAPTPVSGTGPSTGDGYFMTFNYNDSYVTQIAVDLDPTNRLAIRHWKNDTDGWRAWVNILTGANSSVSKSGETLTVKINNTTQSLTNTDYRVTQTVTTSSNTSARPLLLGYSYSDASPKAFTTQGNTSLGQTVYASHNIYVFPSTGVLTIGNKSDTLLGINTSTYKIGHFTKGINLLLNNGSGTGVNDGYVNAITFGNSDTAIYAGIYVQSSGSYGTKMIFGTTGSYADGSYARMIINHSGYVGIGTMTPSYRLHVNGPSMFNGTVNIDSNNLGGTEHINFNRASYNYINIPTGGTFAVSVNGASSTNSKLAVDATSVFPGANNNIVSLGTTAYRWKYGYFADRIFVGGTSFTAWNSNATGTCVGSGWVAVNNTSGTEGYYLMGKSNQYAKLYINTFGVAGTNTTTYTNPNDSTQTRPGYSGAVTGQAILVLGNNIATGYNGSSYSSPGSAGNANNAQGYLRLYSSGTTYGELTGYESWAHANSGLSIRDNAVGIMFRPTSSTYYTHFDYETAGNEALVMATQNSVTSFIFVNGESYANVASDRWTKLTGASGAGPAPGLQIKQNCVRIGGLWASGTNADYKLRVDGSTFINGVMYTSDLPGSWVSGMSANPRIWYNKGSKLPDTGSYHAFWAMKDYPGNVINFGGLNNRTGFYGYYAARTDNSYDWSFTVDMTTGVWSSTKNIAAAGFVKNSSSDSYVLLGGGGHKLISDFATSGHNHDDVYVNVTGDTMTGNLYLKGSANLVTNSTGSYANGIRINRSAASNWAGMTIGYVSSNQSGGGTGSDTHTWMIATPASSDYLNISKNGNTSTSVALTLQGHGNNDLKWNNNTIWHAGNDGTGSGLDADLLDGLHGNQLVPRRYNDRFYPFIKADDSRSIWHKVTLPWAGYTSGSNAWMMTSMELVLGGAFSNNNMGRIYLQYYFIKNTSNVWSAGQIQGVTIGNRISDNGITIKYDIANPGIFYVKVSNNIYNSFAIENISANDTAPSFDFRNTTITAISESDVPASATGVVPLYHTITTQNGYWANIPIQITSSTTTTPQFTRIGLGTAKNDSYAIESAGHIHMTGEYCFIGKLPRAKDDGGGWAYSPFIIHNNANTTLAQIGVYGSNTTLNYIFIGANAYNSTANLQIDSLGYTTATGYKKQSSSNSYVLLGGGGHKLISDFATSGHTHYWANVQVSSSANTETNPQVNNIKARVFTILHPTDTSAERGTLTYKEGTHGWGDYLTTNTNGPIFGVTASSGVYMETSASSGLYVYGGSYYLQIRPESSTCASFYTNSTKYYFNKRIDVQGHVVPYSDLSFTLGDATRRWSNIYGNVLRLQGAPSDPSASAGARIEFTYDNGSNRAQPVYIAYTPNDSYRSPAGLKVFGGSSANPAWFEVEGSIYGVGFIKSGSSNSYVLLGDGGHKHIADWVRRLVRTVGTSSTHVSYNANNYTQTDTLYTSSGDVNSSYTDAWSNFPTTSTPGGGFSLFNIKEGRYVKQIFGCYNDNHLYIRGQYYNNDVVWSTWSTVALTTDNVASATKLQTARNINGTSFNGTADITTANWGTARTITIGNTGKSVNGTANVSWSLSEIGAATSGHTHTFVLGATTITTNGSTYNSITGPFNINTSASADKSFSISRSDAEERVKHWVDDSIYHIEYTNDETANSIAFRFINTDTESPHSPSQASDTTTYLNSSRQFYPSENNTGSIGTSSYKWANMFATTFHGALAGNASTATVATKLGTFTIGGAKQPIYLNAGVATAITATEGGTAQPVYLNAGVITKISATKGGNTVNAIKLMYLNAGTFTDVSVSSGGTAKPVYVDSGSIKPLSATKGGTKQPVYLNAGEITALSETVGASNIPVWFNSGVITAFNSTIGGIKRPVYVSNGAIIGLSGTEGGTAQPVYLYGGVITKISATKGGNTANSIKLMYLNAGTFTDVSVSSGATDKPVYVNGGSIVPITASKGSATKPVYFSSGTISECTYELKATVNVGTAYRLAWYNASSQLASCSNIYSNGVKVAINSTSEPTEMLFVNGDTKVGGDLRVAGNDEYLGTGTGSQCHLNFDNTNKCLRFTFD